jgi:hypothetical protein
MRNGRVVDWSKDSKARAYPVATLFSGLFPMRTGGGATAAMGVCNTSKNPESKSRNWFIGKARNGTIPWTTIALDMPGDG